MESQSKQLCPLRIINFQGKSDVVAVVRSASDNHLHLVYTAKRQELKPVASKTEFVQAGVAIVADHHCHGHDHCQSSHLKRIDIGSDAIDSITLLQSLLKDGKEDAVISILHAFIRQAKESSVTFSSLSHSFVTLKDQQVVVAISDEAVDNGEEFNADKCGKAVQMTLLLAGRRAEKDIEQNLPKVLQFFKEMDTNAGKTVEEAHNLDEVRQILHEKVKNGEHLTRFDTFSLLSVAAELKNKEECKLIVQNLNKDIDFVLKTLENWPLHELAHVLDDCLQVFAADKDDSLASFIDLLRGKCNATKKRELEGVLGLALANSLVNAEATSEKGKTLLLESRQILLESTTKENVGRLGAILMQASLQLTKVIYIKSKEFAKAVQCLREVYNLLQGASEPLLQGFVMNLLFEMGILNLQSGKAMDGISNLEQHLKMQKAAKQIAYTEYVATLKTLAQFFYEQKDAKNSLAKSQELIDFLNGIPQSGTNIQVAEDLVFAYVIAGKIYTAVSDQAKAIEHYEKAFNLERSAFGDVTPNVGQIVYALGGLYRAKNDLPKAFVFYEKALDVNKKLKGEQDVATANILMYLAKVLEDLGDHEKALARLKQALEVNEKHFGKDHPQVASTLNNIGLIYCKTGSKQEGIALFQRACEIQKKYHGASSNEYATALNNVASMELESKNYESALKSFKESYEIFKTHLGENHAKCASLLGNIGRALVLSEKVEEGKKTLARALELHTSAFGSNHPATVKLQQYIQSLN